MVQAVDLSEVVRPILGCGLQVAVPLKGGDAEDGAGLGKISVWYSWMLCQVFFGSCWHCGVERARLTLVVERKGFVLVRHIELWLWSWWS